MLPSLEPRLHLPWQSKHSLLQLPDKKYPLSKAEQLLDQIRQEYSFRDFTIASFCRWAADKSQRMIGMFPQRLAPGIYGVWISCGDEEIIFYDEQASGLYLTHIQIHELAHILCGHRTLDIRQEANLGYGALMDWLHGNAAPSQNETSTDIAQILLRAQNQRQRVEEIEAEALTELIMTEIFGAQMSEQMIEPPSYTQNHIIHEVFQDLGWL